MAYALTAAALVLVYLAARALYRRSPFGVSCSALIGGGMGAVFILGDGGDAAAIATAASAAAICGATIATLVMGRA